MNHPPTEGDLKAAYLAAKTMEERNTARAAYNAFMLEVEAQDRQAEHDARLHLWQSGQSELGNQERHYENS